MKGRFAKGPLFFLFACLLLPPLHAQAALTAAESATVLEVYDGDTLRVRIGDKTETVRLIGIDAPERGHPTREKEFYGDEAAAHLSSLCLGKTVNLEKDEEETDRYNRLLRYVSLPPPDGRLLNLEMLKAGMARAYTRFPFSRRNEFVAAQTLARNDAVGLWKDGGAAEIRWLASGNGRRVDVYAASDGKFVVSHKGWFLDEVRRMDLAREIEWVLGARAQYSDADFSRRALKRGYRPLDASTPPPDAASATNADAFPEGETETITWEEAHRYVDESVIVEGTIVRTYRTSTLLYLNFHPNWKRYLTLVIHEKELSLFPADPENHFKGKTVRARGEIVRRNGRLEMTIRDPADLVTTP